jgi:hypothetical protein
LQQAAIGQLELQPGGIAGSAKHAGVGESEGEFEGVTVRDGVKDGVRVGDGEFEGVPESEPVVEGETDGVGDALAVPVTVFDGDAPALSDAVLDAVGELDLDGVAEAVRVADGVLDGVVVGVAVCARDEGDWRSTRARRREREREGLIVERPTWRRR